MMEKNDWKPKHKNDSHPGLLADINSEITNYTTTISSTYTKPKPVQQRNEIGRRRQLLKEFLLAEYSQKLQKEIDRNEENKEIVKESVMKESFKVQGEFKLKDVSDNSDKQKLFVKYPLYEDIAKSIYLDILDKIKIKPVNRNPKAAFRKNCYFSKPFYADLE